MKKQIFISTIAMILLCFSTSSAQLAIFAGYGQSSFEKEFLGEGVDQAGYIPIGASIQFGREMFKFGLEVNYAAIPFTYEFKDPATNIKYGDVKITQLLLGVFAKIRIITKSDIIPYFRGGGAYFLGETKFDSSIDGLEDSSQDFKGTFGFNAGAGAEIIMSSGALFFEFIYHIVDRELDVDGAKKYSMNNFAGHVGFMFNIN